MHRSVTQAQRGKRKAKNDSVVLVAAFFCRTIIRISDIGNRKKGKEICQTEHKDIAHAIDGARAPSRTQMKGANSTVCLLTHCACSNMSNEIVIKKITRIMAG